MDTINKRFDVRSTLKQAELDGRVEAPELNGLVLLAFDLVLKRLVVLKFGLGELEQANRNILEEARVNATVVSRYIPKLYDCKKYQGAFFLVLEYFEGGSIGNTTLHSIKWDLSSVTQLVLHIANALLMYEQQGIRHNDVSKNNIYRAQRDNELVNVLGDSGECTQGDVKPLRTTHIYSAPELTLEGLPLSYLNSDQYALAMVAYHLLSSTIPKLAQHRFNGDEVTRFFNTLPESGLKRALLRASSYLSAERYSSISEFIAEIKSDVALYKDFDQKQPNESKRFTRGEVLAVAGIILTVAYGQGYLGPAANDNNSKEPTEQVTKQDSKQTVVSGIQSDGILQEQLRTDAKRRFYKGKIDSILRSANISLLDIEYAKFNLDKLQQISTNEDYFWATQAQIELIEFHLENPLKHKVKKDESLYKLQSIYGICIDDIQKANNLTDIDIKEHQLLTIPVWRQDSGGEYPLNCPKYSVSDQNIQENQSAKINSANLDNFDGKPDAA